MISLLEIFGNEVFEFIKILEHSKGLNNYLVDQCFSRRRIAGWATTDHVGTEQTEKLGK